MTIQETTAASAAAADFAEIRATLKEVGVKMHEARVIRATGSSASIVNAPDFRPRAFPAREGTGDNP